MNKVDIYINGQRIDLFQDEQISITLTIQNVQDISKVFNDYTQSFTIPASPSNNRILEHYYRTDIDGVLDFRKRVDAFIEMNSMPFRSGVIQLESVQMKGAEPYAYTLSFFGLLTSLSDTFGEDELSDLDISAYDHSYTSAMVKTGLQSGLFSGNVIYPLMSPKKNWFYDSASNSHDDSNIAYHTTNDDHGIYWYELKPAIKVARLMDAIKAKYGLTFTGTFLSDATFNKLYLWAHHVEGYAYDGKEATMPYEVINFDSTNYPTYDYFDLTTDTFTPIGVSGGGDVYDFAYQINPVSYTGNYYVGIQKNGLIVAESIHSGSATGSFSGIPIANNFDEVQLVFRPASNVQVAYSVDYMTITAVTTSTIMADAYTFVPASYSLAQVNMSSLMPKIKIKDFVTGLIKMHNLVVEYVDGAYKFSTLANFYAAGGTKSIDEFVDVAEYNVSRLPLHRRIEYKYQPTEQILGKYFSERNGVEYGTLRSDFDFDGGEFTIDLPFELPMFERLTDQDTGATTNVLIYKSITKEVDDLGNFNTYIGSPILFYAESGLTLDHQLNFVEDTGNNVPISSVFYCNISSSKTISLAKSLAWGAEIDPYHLKTITKSLYDQYWNAYISAIYLSKKRLVKVSAQLDLINILTLQLNDLIVWHGNTWRINSATLNMNSGRVDFELINEVGTPLIYEEQQQQITNG